MFEDLIELLCNASQGNQEAKEKGGLEDTTIGKPGTPKLSVSSLQADHYRACVIQTCAEILGLKTTALLCKEYIAILNVLTEKFHDVRLKDRTLAVEDYADTLQQMVEEVKDNMLPLHEAFSSKQDQAGTSSVVEIPSSDDMEADSTTKNKHPTMSSSEQIDIQIQLSTSSKAHVGNKRPIESPSEPSCSSEASQSSEKQTSRVKKKKAKHYSQRKCPLCKVRVVHLRRHLVTMHSKRKENTSITSRGTYSGSQAWTKPER